MLNRNVSAGWRFVRWAAVIAAVTSCGSGETVGQTQQELSEQEQQLRAARDAATAAPDASQRPGKAVDPKGDADPKGDEDPKGRDPKDDADPGGGAVRDRDAAVKPLPPSAAAAAELAKLRTRFKGPPPKFPPAPPAPGEDPPEGDELPDPSASEPVELEMASPLAPGLADAFDDDPAGLRAHFPESKGAPSARVLLSRKPTAPMQLEDTKSGAAVDIALQDARDVDAESTEGYLVYRGGHASGATVMHRALPEGGEDFLSFEERPEKSLVTYRVTLQKGVAGLRLVANTLEMLDTQGAPRLRVAPPYVVGADRARTDATLSVEGCNVDTDPAAPWERPVTPPGAIACTIHVSWPSEGVAYPALLDPKWTTTGSMSKERNAHTATVLPTGKVLVTGGTNGSTTFSSAELYDRTTGTWAATASMSVGRKYHTAVLLNTSSNPTTSGKVLVAGGSNGSTALTSAQLYSPSAGTWTSAASMNASRYQHEATLLASGRVLVTGGVSGSYVLKTAAVYNPSSGTGSWTAVSSMSVSRRWHTATLLSTTNATLNNKVLVVGGNSGSNTLTSVQLFDGTSSWTALTSLSSARQEHTATLLTDGKLLVAGGKNGGTTLNTSLLFNPASGSGSWASAGTMTSRRHGQSATLLSTAVVANGQVLLAGGWDGNTTVSSAELFTAPSTWVATNAMPAVAKYHSASLLSNGTVLIAGGVDGSTPLSAAHVYDPSRGLPCSSSAQCPNGFCANGVCCDTACTGECAACNLAGFVGTCSPQASGTACGDEGNPCTTDLCNGASQLCQHPAGNAGATCRTATDACDITETCTGTSASCPADGKAPSGTPCSDGSACTTADVCNGAGLCVGGLPPPTDDGNPCTADSCDSSGGPVHTPLPVGTNCNSLCVTGGVGTCDASGTCVGGTAVTCTASDQCHGVGTCSPATGVCSNPPLPDGTTCDDGRACTQGETCQSGVCGGTNPTCTEACPCGPGNSCTTDSQCLDGLVCGENNGRFFGKDPLSSNCWPPLCAAAAEYEGCGLPWSPCGKCPPAPPRGCTSDTECASTNEVCGQGNGAAFGLGNVNVCWPPVCPGGQTSCGSPLAPCGNCACATTCSSKTCSSPDKTDGCGGYCAGLCGDGQTGCTSNLDCQGGSVCAEGTCLPPICLELDPSRGCPNTHAACPNCPQCASLCASEGRQCGPDPAGCSASCGSCDNGFACVDGQCIDPGPPAPPVDTTAEVGALDGSFSVTDGGQAQYSISIAVPPGRGGMQPDIDLVYTSDKKLGPAGIGWRITGFSAIARCSTRAAGEGPRAVRYDTGDHFCLDGKRLVAFGDGTYRTEVDQFSKITMTPDSNGHPQSFKVYTKAGTILTYGGTENSSVFHAVPGGTSMKRVWGVSRVEDRNGNIMQYAYETRTYVDVVGVPGLSTRHDAFEMVPIEVSYAANGDWEADRGVRFKYKDVGIRSLHYASGGVATTQRQLEHIETYVRKVVARRYKFEYEDRGLVFRLTTARDCAPRVGAEDVCKPPTIFSYDNDAALGPAIPQSEYSAFPLAGWQGTGADIDGDGDDEWFLQGSPFNSPGTTGSGGGRLTIDLHNDGKEKFLQRAILAQNKIRVYNTPGGSTYQDYDFGSGWPAKTAIPVDIDGDGRKDILVCSGTNLGYLTVRFNPQNEIVLDGVYSLPDDWGTCEDEPLLVDFDDDGVVNLLRAQGPGSTNWKALVMPANPGGTPMWVPIGFYEQTAPPPATTSHFRTIDANGDGLVDIWGGTLWINQGDGNFRRVAHTYPGNTFPPGRHIAFDIDGDGNDDILGENGEARWLPPTLSLHYETTPAITPPTRFEIPGYNETYGPFLADTNGDGDLDLIEVRDTGCRNGGGDDPKTGCPAQIRHGHSRRKHLLTSVVDGVGRKIDIVYNGNNKVTPANCANQTDLLCPRKFPPLVGEHHFSIVAPGSNPNPRKFYDYTYADARAGTKGRGSYGFGRRFVEEFDGLEGQNGRGPRFSITALEYHNTDFSRAGLLKSRTVTSGQPTQAVAGFVAPAQRIVEEVLIYEERLNSAATNPDTPIVFPVLRSKTTTVKDLLTGAEAPDIVSTEVNTFTSGALDTDYDNYGNSYYHRREVYAGDITDQLVTYSLTNRGFKPADVANWLVGLVASTQVEDRRNGPSETRIWTYDYDDASGRLIRRTRGPDGPFQQVEEFFYEDAVHNLTRHVLQPTQSPRTTTINFDDSSLTFPYYTFNALGHRTTTIFDPRHGGLVLTETPKRPEDPSGLTETRTYDAFGRLTKVQGPSGTTRITLTKGDVSLPDGRAPDSRAIMRVLTEELSTTGVTGAMKIEDFGPRGEILKRDVTGYQSAPTVDQWVEEYFTYRHDGRLKTQTRPHLPGTSESQGEIDFEYDGTGQLIEERHAGETGETTSVFHASATRNTWLSDPTEYFFGPGVGVEVVSQRVTSTDGAAAAFAKGSVRLMDPEGLTVSARDATGTFTDYTYGSFRQLRKVEVGRDLGAESFIEYFPYGRKMRHSDPDTGVETYDIYNAFDELEQMTDARGVRKEYTYDPLGRMTQSLAFVTGIPEADEKTNWDYDGVDGQPVGPNEIGRLTQVSSGSGADPTRHQTRYRYQAGNFGLLEGVERQIANETFTTAFNYESDFHRLEVVEYPTAGGVFAVKRTYDPRGNLVKVSDGTPADKTYWEVTGTSQGYRIANETFGNSAVTTTEYEPFTGRLRSLRTASQATDGVTLQGFDYSYEPNGNLFSRYNTMTARDERFRYDDLNRLKWITRIGQPEVEVATYDFRGNIWTKDGVGTYNYVHPAGGPRPVHAPRTIVNGSTTRTFFYDASGNEIERTGGPEGTRTTEYTSFNLPTLITDTLPNLTTTFEYDGDNSRVTKREATGSGIRETVYAGSLYERITDNTSGASVVTHKYPIFAEGKQVAQIERTQGVPDDKTVYLHGDHLGSTQLITRAEPAQNSELRVHDQLFDPWGKPEGTAAWDPAADPRAHNVHTGFTGHEHDPEHRLINMQGRIYDPELGRFTTADPIVQAPFYSQSFNRYAYVFNNPLRYTDPGGFATVDPQTVEQWAKEGPPEGVEDIEYTYDKTGQLTEMSVGANTAPSTGGTSPKSNANGAGTPKGTASGTKENRPGGAGGGPGTGGPTKGPDKGRTGVSKEQVRADVDRAAMIVSGDNQRGAGGAGGAPISPQRDGQGGAGATSARDASHEIPQGFWESQFLQQPTREGNYWDRVVRDWKVANTTIPGIFAPPGLGYLVGMGKAVSSTLGLPSAGAVLGGAAGGALTVGNAAAAAGGGVADVVSAGAQGAEMGLAAVGEGSGAMWAVEAGAVTGFTAFVATGAAWEVGLFAGSLVTGALH